MAQTTSKVEELKYTYLKFIHDIYDKKHPTDIQTGCVDESLRAGSYPSYASAQPIGIEYTTEKSTAEQETRLRSLCYTSKQWG